MAAPAINGFSDIVYSERTFGNAKKDALLNGVTSDTLVEIGKFFQSYQEKAPKHRDLSLLGR